MMELTLCLRRAGEEVLLALGADSAEDERRHRALAERLAAQAIEDIDREPDAPHDWSLLAMPAHA